MKIERKTLFSFNDLSEREIKNIEILELIRKKGSISRSDISRATGINMVSISNYMREYMEKGLVVEKGLDVSSGGRKPELIELNTGKTFVAGIDIDRLEVRVSAAGINMDVLQNERTTAKGLAEKDIAAAAVDLVKGVLKRSAISMDAVSAIGVGVLDGGAFSIAEHIEKELGIMTFAGTRAFSAAFAEVTTNSGVEGKALLYIHSDAGRGIIIKDNVFISAESGEGNAQAADDVKYLKPWGSDLEIAQSVKREVLKGVGTKVVDIAKGGIENIAMADVIKAAEAGDQLALDIIQSAGINLGLRMAYLINLFRPEIVILGGGIEKAGDMILGPIRKMTGRLTFTRSADVAIMPSAAGEYAVSFGAAFLAARQIYIKA